MNKEREREQERMLSHSLQFSFRFLFLFLFLLLLISRYDARLIESEHNYLEKKTRLLSISLPYIYTYSDYYCSYQFTVLCCVSSWFVLFTFASLLSACNYYQQQQKNKLQVYLLSFLKIKLIISCCSIIYIYISKKTRQKERERERRKENFMLQ